MQLLYATVSRPDQGCRGGTTRRDQKHRAQCPTVQTGSGEPRIQAKPGAKAASLSGGRHQSGLLAMTRFAPWQDGDSDGWGAQKWELTGSLYRFSGLLPLLLPPLPPLPRPQPLLPLPRLSLSPLPLPLLPSRPSRQGRPCATDPASGCAWAPARATSGPPGALLAPASEQPVPPTITTSAARERAERRGIGRRRGAWRALSCAICALT